MCYERTTTATGALDTCCFSITVNCNTLLVAETVNPEVATAGKRLLVTTSSNPASSSFRFNITSGSLERVSLQVSDMMGRVVETRDGIAPSQPLQIGVGYRLGTYFARVVQGTDKVEYS